MTATHASTIEKRFEEFGLPSYFAPDPAVGRSALAIARGVFTRARNRGFVQEVEDTERVLAVPGLMADDSWLDMRRRKDNPGTVEITKIYNTPQLESTYPGNIYVGSKSIVASGRTAYPLKMAGITAVFGFSESMRTHLGGDPSPYTLNDQLSAFSFEGNFGIEASQEAPNQPNITDLNKVKRLRRGLSLMTDPIADYIRLDLMFCEPVDPASVSPDPAQLLTVRPNQAVVPIFHS